MVFRTGGGSIREIPGALFDNTVNVDDEFLHPETSSLTCQGVSEEAFCTATECVWNQFTRMPIYVALLVSLRSL